MNEDIGYIEDWTTCKGGENLSDKDRDEINDEFKEKWGDK